MKISNKIATSIEQISERITEIRKSNKSIVLCQGHFNVIHPGHLRFLEFANREGDYLIVAVQGSELVKQNLKNSYFTEDQRARSVASLEYVDLVIVFNEKNFSNIIDKIQPNIYVTGEEFKNRISEIQEDIKHVESHGGKVVFSSGDMHYTTTEFLEKGINDIRHEREGLFKKALLDQKINLRRLIDLCETFKDKHILVIGDTIVDQYVACEAVGMSSEAPVLVVRELEKKNYIGGAAIVSKHVQALGAKCTFISVTGNDDIGKFVSDDLSNSNIGICIVVDSERPTTFKIRYMVGPQKILRVSRLMDQYINIKVEEQIISAINNNIGKIDGIVVSDFGYGTITPAIIDHIDRINKNGVKIFGDVQSSSNIGNIAKFNNYYCITPTEKEARIALADKYSGLEVIGNKLLQETNSQNVFLTLGEEGMIVFMKTKKEFTKTQHFPALNPMPRDVVGAGDSLLAGLAISSCSGASIMEAAAFANIVASNAVNKIGNIPVEIEEVKEVLHNYCRC